MKRSFEFNRSVSSVAAIVGFNTLFRIRDSQEHRRQSTRILVGGLSIFMLFAIAVFIAPTAANAGEVSIGISLRVGPPPISVYTQPVCPGPGFMWTPGYWAFDPGEGYYWVPGTWVEIPSPGMYWTPGYWGWGGSVFVWHAGYWGPHVGFYGGINYGFGYKGVGFVGGEWRGGEFYYNRSVANIGRGHIDHVYYHSVPNNFAEHRVSYNGGEGGLNAHPGREEVAAEHERHVEATSIQRQHQTAARGDRSQFASVNHGMPGVAATGRPGELRGAGAVPSVRSGGPMNPGGNHGTNPEHNAGYSGYHNPNLSGGAVTHQPTTNYNHALGSPAPGSPAPGSVQRGTASREFHTPAPPVHNAPSGAPPVNHGSTPHPPQPQSHTPPPSGGGHPRHEPDRNH